MQSVDILVSMIPRQIKDDKVLRVWGGKMESDFWGFHLKLADTDKGTILLLPKESGQEGKHCKLYGGTEACRGGTVKHSAKMIYYQHNGQPMAILAEVHDLAARMPPLTRPSSTAAQPHFQVSFPHSWEEGTVASGTPNPRQGHICHPDHCYAAHK